MTAPTPTVEAESREAWVLVPREPTGDMEGKGFAAAVNHKDFFGVWFSGKTTAHVDIYRAMIAAAPSPATGGVETAQAAFDATMVEEIIDTIKTHPSGRFSERQKVELMLELSPAYASPPPIAGPTKEEVASVLKPFADVADKAKGSDDACWCGQDGAVIRYRDLRAARDLLALFNGAGR